MSSNFVSLLRSTRSGLLQRLLTNGESIRTVCGASTGSPYQAASYQASKAAVQLKSWLRKSDGSEESYLSMQMPPNEIFYDAEFFKDENRPGGIFRNFWTYVGHTGQFSEPGEGKFITSTVGFNLPIVIVQDESKTYRGFVNVCRHRATILLQKAEAEDKGGCGLFGKKITCMYHGWEYTPDGRLAKALKMKGVQGFSAKDHSLFPIQVELLGNLIFARVPDNNPSESSGEKNTTPPSESFDSMLPGLRERMESLRSGDYIFVGRHSYEMECNWKIFADNYLDGGYHIHSLHPGLASQLDLKTYRVHLFPHYSVQSCDVPPHPVLAGREVPDRVGPPEYTWVFPVTGINKYGDWLDVHVVRPLSPTRCGVVFDYFVAGARVERLAEKEVRASVAASHDVQVEDMGICEMVQRGLSSAAYRPGRYAAPENASFHFHQALANHI